MMAIESVKQKWEKRLLKLANVTGVGIGKKYVKGKPTNETCIVVFVTRKLTKEALKPQDIVPAEIEGVKTDVREATFKALTTPEEKQKKWRPAKGGVSIGHFCYDEKTRVLTKKGLKKFNDLTRDDEIATLNPKTKELEYQKPITIFEYDYEGEMIHFKTSRIDLMVTPNHRVYAKNRNRKKEDFSLIEAERINSDNFQFLLGCEWNCTSLPEFELPLNERAQLYKELEKYETLTEFSRKEGIPYKTAWRWKHRLCKPHSLRNVKFRTIDFLELLGWYISEGSISGSTVYICEKSRKFHSEILNLLRRMGLRSWQNSDGTIGFAHKQLAKWFEQNCGRGAKNKRIPEQFKQLPREELKILLDALVKGDGDFRCGHPWRFTTVSERLATDLLEIGLKAGFAVWLKVEKNESHEYGGRTIKGGKVYRVYFTNEIKSRISQKPERIHYNGKIYCVEVPNHVILVERNGKLVWSGNSVTAGTLACLVKDETDGEKVILSNNHVLANSNDADLGSPIVQPGVYDGGNVLTDTIAKLKRFVPIQFEQGSTCPVAQGFCAVYNSLAKAFGAKTRLVTVKEVYNTVDCAVASPVSPDVVSDEIIDIGVPQGVVTPQVGLKVRKSGRTTCLTHGEIDTVDLTVRVMYDYKTALFKDQIGIQPIEGKFSAGGDSGSAIIAEDEPKIVGLLFAGDESGYTIANQIQNVMDELNVTV
jgi:hypothetical protein